MGNSATLGDLRRRCLQAADASGMQTIVPAGDYTELDGYINDSLSELHDLLVLRFEDYFRSVATISVPGNTEKVPLPIDFYKEIAVFRLNGNTRNKLNRAAAREIALGESYDLISDSILGNSLFFSPRTGATQEVEVWYIPQHHKLVNKDDKVEYSIASGWEEYIVVDVAIKIRDKLQLDCSVLMARKQGLTKRIEMAASTRSVSRLQGPIDVRGDL